MGSFHVTAWLQFYSGFCFLSGFKTYLWNKSFTDESLYSLFVLNKAYLLTISMFESLKFYTFSIWFTDWHRDHQDQCKANTRVHIKDRFKVILWCRSSKQQKHLFYMEKLTFLERGKKKTKTLQYTFNIGSYYGIHETNLPICWLLNIHTYLEGHNNNGSILFLKKK